ncbi:phi PV83 orf 10-like protein [Staphylococcus schweitzeri]|nr:phi PV83 orf 10-like protein [Staphylococcus schweitzeri]
MHTLYKITLLITMAVVTWKVWKIEVNTRKPVIDNKVLSNRVTGINSRRFGSFQ